MFSLLDEPWIPVVDHDGNRKLIGVKDVFAGEVNVVQLQGDSPAQDYAVLRMLLAIFWRAHRKESQVAAGETFIFAAWVQRTRKILRKKQADPVVLEYLERYRDRFDLVDSPTPFMQVAGLHVASGEVKRVTTIVPEASSDYFAMRAGQIRETLTYAEAARWLIYTQAYDFSGIKSGVVGDSRAKGGRGYPIGVGWTGMTGGTLIVGDNLLDTLILNTVPESITNPNDKPVWERNPDGPDVRSTVGESAEPQGPADLATWQSRRVLLHHDGNQVVGVVLGQGDKIPDAGANVMADPMTPYRYSPNKSTKKLDVYYPRPYDVERTTWKSLDPLVVAETDGGFSGKEKAPKRPRILTNLAELSQKIDGLPPVLNVELFSVEYGPQASSVATTYSARMHLPLVLLMESSVYLRTEIRALAAATTQSAVALGRFAGNLLVAAGGEYGFKTAVTDRVLAELEPRFHVWLQSIATLSEAAARQESESTQALITQWQLTVRTVIDEHARTLLRGAGPKAFSGRVIGESAEGARGRFVSAATYYQLLQHSLNEALPTTASPRTSDADNSLEGATE